VRSCCYTFVDFAALYVVGVPAQQGPYRDWIEVSRRVLVTADALVQVGVAEVEYLYSGDGTQDQEGATDYETLAMFEESCLG